MKLTSTSTVSERITALVSAAVAIALLGLAVSAQTGLQTATDPLEQLESEARLQFRLGLGHDQALLDARSSELEKVLQAFRASDETSANRQRLIDWLREAMVRSMPGSIRPLPQAPAFEAAPDAAHESVSDADEMIALPTEDSEEQVVALQQQVTVAPSRLPVAVEEEPRPVAEPADQAAPSDADSSLGDVLDVPDPEDIATPGASGPIPTLADPRTEAPQPDTSATSGDGFEATLPAPGPLATGQNAPARPARPTLVRPVVATPGQRPATLIETPPPTPRPASDRVESPVAVNTSRLSEEMASYHRSLGKVRDACRGKGLTFAALQDAVDTLERLTTQYDFVRLYYDLLSPGEQERLGQPNHWGVVLPEVRDALNRVARQTNGDFLRPLESDRQEALGDLRRQVDKLSREALP